MAKVRYRLLKESVELKKGAVLIEQCDGGNQNFVCEDVNKYMKRPKGHTYSTYWFREDVVKQPKWFERVYTFCDIEITEKQKNKLLKLIGIKKRGRPKKK